MSTLPDKNVRVLLFVYPAWHSTLSLPTFDTSRDWHEIPLCHVNLRWTHWPCLRLLDLSERLWTSEYAGPGSLWISPFSSSLRILRAFTLYRRLNKMTQWRLKWIEPKSRSRAAPMFLSQYHRQWESMAISGNLSKSHRTSPLSSLAMPRRCPLSWCWLWTTWQDCAGYLRHWCQLMSASVFATLWAIPQTTYKDGMGVSWFGAAKGHRPQARMQRWFS